MPSGNTAVHALVFTASNEKLLFLLISIVADFSAADQVPPKSKVTMRPAIVVVVVGGIVVVVAMVVVGVMVVEGAVVVTAAAVWGGAVEVGDAVVGGVVVVFARCAMVVATTVLRVVCGDGEPAIETTTVLEEGLRVVVVGSSAAVVEVGGGTDVAVEADAVVVESSSLHGPRRALHPYMTALRETKRKK